MSGSAAPRLVGIWSGFEGVLGIISSPAPGRQPQELLAETRVTQLYHIGAKAKMEGLNTQYMEAARG